MGSRPPGNLDRIINEIFAVEGYILILETAGWTEVMTSGESSFVDSLVNRLGQVGGLGNSSVGIHEQLSPVVEGDLLSGIVFSLGGDEGNLRGKCQWETLDSRASLTLTGVLQFAG